MRVFPRNFCRLLAAAFVMMAQLQAQRAPVEGAHSMVASASTLASQAGAEILRQGGNAVDAAVVVALTLPVTYPRAGNLGGGGFMVVALADGRTATIDYRETAPAAASRDMYVGPDGKVISDLSLVGHKAAGVPGTIAGLALALEKYGSGKFTWAQLVEPARRLAAEGITVTEGLARDLRAQEKLLSQFPDTKRIYLRNGQFYAEGEHFAQPDLAGTFARLQKSGASEFYNGETARLIAEEMTKNHGLITADDLRNYHAIERPALRGAYRGYEIITVPPPSSGGIVLLEMLAMIEPRDLASLGRVSAARYHLYAEVMRRAFRDRAEYLGDPDFVKIPVAGLLDPVYAQHLMANFDPNHATPSKTLSPGVPVGLEQKSHPAASGTLRRESPETTHFSIVDDSGNAVSNTYTLNGLYGCGVTVPGTGILLNNEMDDFASAPGTPNMFGLVQGEANAIAPHKRPLSSMTPTIVRKDGKVFIATGSPGGATIPNTVFVLLTGIIDDGLSLTEAVDQPRIHHQWLPDQLTYEPEAFPEDVAAALKAKGQQLVTRSVYKEDSKIARSRYYWGDAESVMVDPKSGRRLGANDLRSPDSGARGD